MSAGASLLLRSGGARPAFVVDTQGAPEPADKPEPPVRVLLHNDDITPAEYVVVVLRDDFGHGWWRANAIMLRAHVTGRSPVGVYPRPEAEERVARAHQRARRDGWPLRFTIEPQD